MTAIHEGVTPAVNSDEAVVAPELTPEQQRFQHICTELGKMAPQDEVVRDFRVEGWNRICSPVMGNIIVATSSTEAGIDLTERVVHPTASRERIADLTVFDDLNKLGAEWRAKQNIAAPVPLHFHDQGRG